MKPNRVAATINIGCLLEGVRSPTHGHAKNLYQNLYHPCTAVIDGVIHDTHDPSQRGTTIYPPHTPLEQMPKNVRWLENGNGWAYEPKRCVYGYWSKVNG